MAANFRRGETLPKDQSQGEGGTNLGLPVAGSIRDLGNASAANGSDREAARQSYGPGSPVAPDGGIDPYETLRKRLKNLHSAWGHPDDPIRQSCPILAHHWTVRALPNGKAKECPRITIQPTPLGFSATLMDFSLSYTLTVECKFFHELMAAMDRALSGEGGVYKEVRRGEGYQRRKEALKKQVDKSEELL